MVSEVLEGFRGSETPDMWSKMFVCFVVNSIEAQKCRFPSEGSEALSVFRRPEMSV